ncbi:MAG TPA: pilus assembly protein N-terminal domain-containing protein [Labilithrix sp.]|nr:pilus assembly protein N-terminal domain-containing protein [Labilithrix sp.]
MIPRRVVSALGALAALFIAPAASAAQPPQDRNVAEVAQNGDEFSLAVGETKTISARDVRNFSEGSAGIVEIKLTSDNSQFVINGKKPGSTSILLIKNDGSQVSLAIHVFARSPAVVERELAQLLDGLTTVRVRRVGARTLLDGVVANDAERKRVQHVASLYPNQVESLVTLPGGGGTTSDANGRYIIRIDFYFVQYDKNSTYGVGLAWPGSVGGDAVIKSTVAFDFVSGNRAATASITNQPLPRLDIASRKGWAKVLKQATVVTNNGVEANFANGGEQNFTVTAGLTAGIQKIAFGTDVTVLPRYNATKREVEMKLVADVSDLTSGVAGTTLPGRTTSKLTTNITLKLGQSIVLSGIRAQSQTHAVTGLPVLSDIPVLGLLFGSHANLELQTEGAVFVVPSVVETVPAAAAEMVDTAIAKFADYSGAIDKVNAFEKKPGGAPTVKR